MIIDNKIVKEYWKEIKKQAIKGSGIHLAIQVLPDCKLYLTYEMDKFGMRFAESVEIHSEDMRPKDAVKIAIEKAIRTKKLTRKELIKFNLI